MLWPELPKPQTASVLLHYWSLFPDCLCFFVAIYRNFCLHVPLTWSPKYHSTSSQVLLLPLWQHTQYCIQTDRLLNYYYSTTITLLLQFVTPYEQGLINPKTPYEWFLRVSSLDTEMRIYEWCLRVSYEWLLRVSSLDTERRVYTYDLQYHSILFTVFRKGGNSLQVGLSACSCWS